MSGLSVLKYMSSRIGALPIPPEGIMLFGLPREEAVKSYMVVLDLQCLTRFVGFGLRVNHDNIEIVRLLFPELLQDSCKSAVHVVGM